MKKQIGYIGLGKIGRNMISRLRNSGWKIVAYDNDTESARETEEIGAKVAQNLEELVSELSEPRTVWLMVPHYAVAEVVNQLIPFLGKGDIIIDGSNSPYQDSMKRADKLATMGIEFLDVGVSGGPSGALTGACMMAGGKKELYDTLEKSGFFDDTCMPRGFGYMGPSGAGHFTKMVHNGIEYGMMQSIAEGFDLLRHSQEFNLDLVKVTDVYSHGSVIASSLVSWMHEGYRKYGKDLNAVSGRASASGEGKWTVEAGERENISMPAIQASLNIRSASQQKPSYQGKVVSTMRGEFGQHPVKRGEEESEIL